MCKSVELTALIKSLNAMMMLNWGSCNIGPLEGLYTEEVNVNLRKTAKLFIQTRFQQQRFKKSPSWQRASKSDKSVFFIFLFLSTFRSSKHTESTAARVKRDDAESRALI